MSFTVKKRLISVLIAAVLLVGAIFTLCACNTTDNTSVDYALYFNSISYDEVTLTAYATVSLTGKEENKLDVEVIRNYELTENGFWYKYGTTTYSFNPSALFSAVSARIAQDDMIVDGVPYARLKLLFVYDTIYKNSVTSDGFSERFKNGVRHSYYPDETAESFSAAFVMRSQNSANWYAVLIGAGLGVGATAVLIAAAVKRKQWQKKKEK